jgi:hypothetical protein
VAEPATTTSAGIVAIAIVLLGPIAGEHAAIAFCALAGALWALSSAKCESRAAGAWLVAKLVFTAVVLTGAGVWLLEDLYDWPARHVLPALAFLIGLFGHRWPSLAEAISNRLMGRVRGSETQGTEK